MGDNVNEFFCLFFSLQFVFQARSASQSSELSAAADARGKLEAEVSRLKAEADSTLKGRVITPGARAKLDIL